MLRPKEQSTLSLFGFEAAIKNTANLDLFWFISTQVGIRGLFALKCTGNFASAAIYLRNLEGDMTSESWHSLDIGTGYVYLISLGWDSDCVIVASRDTTTFWIEENGSPVRGNSEITFKISGGVDAIKTGLGLGY